MQLHKFVSKNHFKIVGAILLMAIGQLGNAQQSHPEYSVVMQVVENFFDSINTGDGELIASLEVEGAHILNIREDIAGKYEFVERDWFGADNFGDDNKLTERYWDEQLLLSDNLAVFWAQYDFHINGEFSHCGTDVLNLIKIEGAWKIGHAMWTIQRPGCEESPLGPLH